MDRCHIHLHYSLLDYEAGQHVARDVGGDVSCFDSHDNRSPTSEPRRDRTPVVVVGRIVCGVVILPCVVADGSVIAG